MPRVWLAILALGLTATSTRAQDTGEAEGKLTLDQFAVQDACITCHLDPDYLPDGLKPYDVHLQAGVSCVGCHGGVATSDDEEIAMNPDSGFVGVPSYSEVPQFCGKCHASPDYMHDYRPMERTDQVSQYGISVHGKRLREGDTKVANCVSCHTAHSILPASDTRSTVYPANVPLTCRTCHSDPIYMREYGIPTNQFREYAGSVHGKALLEDHDMGAPACNDCHGNHGALPPEMSSVAQICGSCHVNNLNFYVESPMGRAFLQQDLHGCAECHGYHDVSPASVTMVGTTPEAVCMDCHSQGERGYNVAAAIRSDMDTVTAALDSASTMQDEVVRVGMDDLDIEYLLKEGRQDMIQARTTVHTFNPDRVSELTTAGTAKAREAIGVARERLEEHFNRRMGFALGSLFITILAVGLYLRIREIDAKTEESKPRASD